MPALNTKNPNIHAMVSNTASMKNASLMVTFKGYIEKMVPVRFRQTPDVLHKLKEKEFCRCFLLLHNCGGDFDKFISSKNHCLK
jgi:hypothetical protein